MCVPRVQINAHTHTHCALFVAYREHGEKFPHDRVDRSKLATATAKQCCDCAKRPQPSPNPFLGKRGMSWICPPDAETWKTLMSRQVPFSRQDGDWGRIVYRGRQKQASEQGRARHPEVGGFGSSGFGGRKYQIVRTQRQGETAFRMALIRSIFCVCSAINKCVPFIIRSRIRADSSG